VEAKLRFGAGVENGNFTSILSPVSPHDNVQLQSQQQQRTQNYSPEAYNHISPPVPTYTPTQFVSTSFRQTQSEAMTARPSFLTFCCPPFVDGESWDDTSLFYDEEMAAGELLHSQCLTALEQPPDISRKSTRHLQQNFVQNFLSWFPIFDLSACIHHVDEAFASNFSSTNPSSCLTFLLFAIGAVSDTNNHNLSSSDPPAGIAYLARGNQMLDGLALKTGDLTVLQCRILQAAYYQFAIRPLQAWNSIVQASRDVMHILSGNRRGRLDAVGRDGLHRVFWATSIIHQ
jgi:hypothetical protein